MPLVPNHGKRQIFLPEKQVHSETDPSVDFCWAAGLPHSMVADDTSIGSDHIIIYS